MGVTWLALMGLFSGEWEGMARQWWGSSTYTHILLVPAILVWLVSVRVQQLKRLVPQPWWPGLALFAAALGLWLLGSLADVDLVSQTGAVAMLVGAAVTLLGPKVGAALCFPLGYMAFLVPFGDEFVPLLQLVTAKLTVWLTALSGIPAHVDGVFIDTPAGLFEVAEACSGVKFLIAMLAFGALVANVGFRTWRRRVAFLIFALLLSVLANGVRAWGTIFAAQYVGAERATGLDHLVYGWIFFAVVIVICLATGRRFFDRPADDPMIDAAAIEASPVLTRLARLEFGPAAATLFLIGSAAVVLAWAALATRQEATLPREVALPEVPGWRQVPYRPSAEWRPQATGADHRLLGRYRNAAGAEVDVFFALYGSQGAGKEASGFGEGALTPDSGWAWLAPAASGPDATAERLLGPGQVERHAETRYRQGELLTGSGLQVRLATLRDRLLLRARPTAMLILSAEKSPGRDPAASLRAFRASAGPLGPWMDQIAGVE